MMAWGAGWGGWLWMLAGVAFVVGVVLCVVWLIQRAGGLPQDDALSVLRARFARGELDSTQFEEMRRVLGTEASRGRDRIGLIGLLLIVGAIIAWIIASAYVPAGWSPGGGWHGMIGPDGMMGRA
jgi:putative membrane protein